MSWSSASEVTFHCCSNTPLWSLSVCSWGHHDPTRALSFGGGVQRCFLEAKAHSECRSYQHLFKGKLIPCHGGAEHPWRPQLLRVGLGSAPLLCPAWGWSSLAWASPAGVPRGDCRRLLTVSVVPLSPSLSQLSAWLQAALKSVQSCGGDVVGAWLGLKSARSNVSACWKLLVVAGYPCLLPLLNCKTQL